MSKIVNCPKCLTNWTYLASVPTHNSSELIFLNAINGAKAKSTIMSKTYNEHGFDFWAGIEIFICTCGTPIYASFKNSDAGNGSSFEIFLEFSHNDQLKTDENCGIGHLLID